MRVGSFRYVLDECLAALQQGESIESCLARYPRQAERLRPLLMLAERVRRTPAAPPRAWARDTAWAAVRERAAGLRFGRRGLRIAVNYGPWLRPLAVATALVMAVMMGGGATALAAQSALPDSPLYRVKLMTEDVRLWFVFDDSHEAEILLDQSGTRIDEIMSMVTKGKPVPDNVLSALHDRNQRAAVIMENRPENPELLARLLEQSASQEELLIALWPNVSDSARPEYTEAVALVHNLRLQGSGGLVYVRAEDLAGGILNVSGEAVSIGDGVWSVGGVEIHVDQRAIGLRELFDGASTRAVVARNSSGQLYALSLASVAADAPPASAFVSGAVEEITSEGVRVGGQFIPITPETLLTLKLKEGQRVEITLGDTSGGVVAASVKPAAATAAGNVGASLTFEGNIEGAFGKSSNEWKAGGLNFTATDSTRVDAKAGTAQEGARVQIEAMNENGQLMARSVTVLASTADARSVHLIGAFQGSNNGGWLVSGLTVVPPEGAQEPERDSLLVIDAQRDGRNLVVERAAIVQEPGDSGLVRVQGAIESISGQAWNLEIAKLYIASNAVRSGDPIVGTRALAFGHRGHDGEIDVSYVRVLDTSPVTATPSPSATPAPTPSP